MTFLILLTCSLPACNQESFVNEVGLPQNQAQSTKEWDDYLKRIGEFKIDLSLQGFEIKDVWMQAHATFRISFEFDIGEDFHPTHIQLVSGEREINDITAAKGCLAAWTLSGLQPNTKYSMVLVWEHGEGYKMLTLAGEQMNLTIRLGHLIK
ncbi:MAG: hypothetical protein MIO92_15105 [Methanosarcinaceae archaeon]|nr:hypothetical protein [Methanosarcinaceae archaeon]